MNWINTEDAAHIIETHAINRRPVTYDFVIHAGDGCIMENERTIDMDVSIDAARHQEMTARLTVIHDPQRHPDNDVERAFTATIILYIHIYIHYIIIHIHR
jgi:hypothetical protein